jgi:hypothetical protein
MPAGETGKRKLPDPPEFSKTPDKRPSVQTSSTGSSAPEAPRRSLFQCARKEEEHRARAQLAAESEESSCNRGIARSGAACSAAGPQAMSVSKILFGPLPSREALTQYFNAAETQVRASVAPMPLRGQDSAEAAQHPRRHSLNAESGFGSSCSSCPALWAISVLARTSRLGGAALACP